MDRTSNVLTWLAAASFVGLVGACARPLETVRIDGSPGVAPLVGALVASYRETNPSSPVDMTSGLGSSARLAAVETGRIHIAMASHGAGGEELEKRGLASRHIARTAVLFGVNATVAVGALTRQQVCDVYSGRITNWRDLGGPALPVKALMRPSREVDAEVALEGVACLRDVKLASDVQVIERPDDMARAIAATTGAIGLTSAPMVEQSGGRIKPIALDGVTPTIENVTSGAYPLTRRAMLVYRKTMQRAVAQFLAFVASPEGERVIRANGAVPQG
jgi:phosphate transport system substrate-binding protein